jgi:hypothetical protein
VQRGGQCDRQNSARDVHRTGTRSGRERKPRMGVDTLRILQ